VAVKGEKFTKLEPGGSKKNTGNRWGEGWEKKGEKGAWRTLKDEGFTPILDLERPNINTMARCLQVRKTTGGGF